MGNTALRVTFALGIVCAAIGMTAAASDTVARCDAPSARVAPADGTVSCAPEGAPAVAGFQSLPDDRAAETARAEVAGREAMVLVGVATAAVAISIFAILFMNRLRPGGVRASHR